MAQEVGEEVELLGGQVDRRPVRVRQPGLIRSGLPERRNRVDLQLEEDPALVERRIT